MILLQLLILFSPALSFSQIGNWIELPNAPVVTRFNDIQFLNENQGWAVNGWGQIYHSPDEEKHGRCNLNNQTLISDRLDFLMN